MPEFLEGTVDVPVAGRMKKAYIYVPAGLAAVYVVYRWYQAGQSGDQPEQSDGLYSSEDLTDLGLSTTGGSSTVGGNSNSSTDGTSSTAIDDNAEWTQRAVELLGNQGYSGQAVSAALGEFLDRRALDKSEATIVRSAIGLVGQPPEGRPWSVIEEAGSSTGTLPAPTNLRVVGTPTTSTVTLQWDKVEGALHYRLYRTDLGEEPVGDSYDTKAYAKGLSPNKSYPFFVRAFGTTGKPGGKSNIVTAKTAQVKLTAPTGLRSSSVQKSSFRVTCNKVTGATYYRWYVNGKPSGASDQPYRDFTGLKSRTTYSITVAADTGNQTPSGQSKPLRVKTK